MYSQNPATVAYPDVETDAWVVISRLSELPVRMVPKLSFVNHASEFALPFPTGNVPFKVAVRTFEKQKVDDIGRPIYFDDPDEVTDDVNEDGDPLPPVMEEVEEETIVTLRDYPELFSLDEVFNAVLKDFLMAYPFYDYGNLIVFDDRYDSISLYEDQQETSGLASGSHPLFMGPIQASLDPNTNPRGHLMLIAPTIPGVNYYFQIRHGIAAENGEKGPIQDIAMASRQRQPATYTDGVLDEPLERAEICHWLPLTNFHLIPEILTDAADVEVNYYWLRTGLSGLVDLVRPYPVIPFIIVLGRSTGA